MAEWTTETALIHLQRKLVVPKDQAQRVKDVVDRLRDLGWEDVL